MIWFWLIAWMAGLASVTQSGLSKRLAEKAGLASVLHLSNLVVLIGGIIILTSITVIFQNEFAQLLRIRLTMRAWSWLFLIPGLMGLFIITVMPLTIMKLGALNVFVAMVFGQVLGSAIWDYFLEDIPLDYWRVGGAGLTLLGAIAVSLSKAGP